MTISEAIEKALLDSFAQARAQLNGAAAAFTEAKRVLDIWSPENLARYGPGIPKEFTDTLTREAERRIASSRGKNTEVVLELVLTRAADVQLYLPVPYVPQTGVEAALAAHAETVMRHHDATMTAGHVGEYLAFRAERGHPDELDRLRTMLAKAPKALEHANVRMEVYDWSLPIKGRFGDDIKTVTTRATPSAVTYQLIPLSRVHGSFFPELRQEFTLQTAAGDIKVHVTSQRPQGTGSGNYICSSGDGSLGRAITALGIQSQDQLRITSLRPPQVYALQIVSAPPTRSR